MSSLTKEMREDLIAKGREDLVEVFDINASGYAAILSNGNIVSRLQYPTAIPMPENSSLNIPKPKKIKSEITSDYVCIECGLYFLTEEQLKEKGGAHTAHGGHCAVCDKVNSLLHIRHYNWLEHYKYKVKN